jgi:anti-sigma factor RsiW
MIPGHDDDRDLEQLDPSELELLAYLDGELDGDGLRAFEARLASDRELGARVRALTAVGGFVRGDADRIYGAAKVDSIVDDVMARVRAEEPHLAEVIPLSAHVAPLTSRADRTKKNTVIWVTFGAVAAAAAGLIVWTGANELKTPVAPVASATTSAEVVAKVNIVPPPPSNPPAPVPESASTVEVEDLEVGSGATVVYTRGEEGSSPVVWITGREAK